jgi:ATP phosphoribosyltransferase regulatory subunit
VAKDTTRNLLALLEHYGDLDVLDRAERALRWPAARKALRNLREIVERLSALGIRDELGLDLGDARGSSYYTGISFSVLAEGPGEPIGGGGRYDSLLSRFGADQPATGFAFDLENLQWALRTAGAAPLAPQFFRVVLALGDERENQRIAAQLRARGVVVATLPKSRDARSCLAFARAWGYDAALVRTRGVTRILRAEDADEQVLVNWRSSLRLSAADAENAASLIALKRWAQESNGVDRGRSRRKKG